MHGADTELDRQVLELIKDPLTHLVRNCADHGIEGPAERIAAGKPQNGTIRLSAWHQGGHIIIEIADDGRGLDIATIRTKVIENGLASEADLAAKSETEICNYHFHARFYHGRAGHQHFRARRRHGCGAQQYRADRRNSRIEIGRRRRNHLHDQNSSHARDRFSADRRGER